MPDTRRGGGSRSCHVAIASQGARGTRGGGVTRRCGRLLGDDAVKRLAAASGSTSSCSRRDKKTRCQAAPASRPGPVRSPFLFTIDHRGVLHASLGGCHGGSHDGSHRRWQRRDGRCGRLRRCCFASTRAAHGGRISGRSCRLMWRGVTGGCPRGRGRHERRGCTCTCMHWRR